MRNLIILLILIFIGGCSSHWVTKENEEKNLSFIQIESKYKINVEPMISQDYWGRNSTDVQIDGFKTFQTSSFDRALRNSLNASQYFQVVNDNHAPILKITLKATDFGMRVEGFLGYMVSLGTLPFPVSKTEYTATITLHTPDGLQIKEYSYPIKTEGSLTVFTPFALFLGEPEPVFAKTYMDVVVSQLISDLNRDEVFINI